MSSIAPVAASGGKVLGSPSPRWWSGGALPHAGAGEPGQGALLVLASTVALLPVITPKLPGNAAPIDGPMIATIFAVFIWALRTKATLRVPYVVPTTALMLVGAASALFSILPGSGAVAVAQEIFLLAWCAAVATLCRTPRALGIVLRTWAVSATAWAGLLIVVVGAGVGGALAATNGGGVRYQMLFDHPNMAGNFFVVAMFVMVACGYPGRLWLRLAFLGVLFVGTLLTGSNAALLSLVAGAIVTLFMHVRVRAGLIQAVAVTSLLVGGLGLGWSQVGEPLLASASTSDNPLLRYSVGRGADSAEGRVDLFSSQFDLYQRGHLLGIGPTATQDTLDATAASIVKEAHSDYLGTLVERGPFGLLAVFALIGVIVARLVALSRRPLPPRLAAAIPVPAAFAGACAALAATAVTHEVLHYRWLWLLLGIIAAVHILQGAKPEAPAGAVSTALVPHRPRPPRAPSRAR
jgi:O-antigen ligase